MIVEKENELFAEWEKKYPGFCRDGVVDEAAYLSGGMKILYLMKEVNAKGSVLDLKKFLQEGGRPQTWDNIARWTYGIRHHDRDIGWSELEADNMERLRPELLKSICVVNLKKTSGGHTTDKSALSSAAVADEELILRQMDLYAPDLIIACGSDVTESFLRLGAIREPAWKQTFRGIWYFRLNPGTLFISYLHPEARVKDCLLFYGLADAVREVLGPMGGCGG